MLEVIKNIIANVLTALYQSFGFSILLAVLFMFLHLFAKEKGWRSVTRHWWESFKTDVSFRYMFFLTFYTSMILFRTLLNRKMWENPVSNVLGVWGIYTVDGQLTTEVIENLILFIPFTTLLFLACQEKFFHGTVTIKRVLEKSAVCTFLVSLTIEFLQLFLRLGTFQLSDLFYNTVGGITGGCIYWGISKISMQREQK